MSAPNFSLIPGIPPDETEHDYDETERHRGQLRFAERYVREHRGEMLHVHGLGWHEYDGARWVENLDGGETRAMVNTIKQAQQDLGPLEKDARDELMKDITKCESRSGMNGVLGIAGDMRGMSIAARVLDSDPWLLNTSTGTVDLRTGRVRNPNPEDHLSKVTGGGFDPDAQADVFDRFLEQVQPDPDMRAFIARSLGSALLGKVREQVLLIWYGAGANGKSVLRDAVANALGDYAVETRPELLIAQKNRGSIDDIGKLRLKGSRVAFCSEISEGARLDEAVMKRLTGNDPIEGKLLYEQSIVFEPSHQLVMLTNHLPVVRGDDPATWRRMMAVPWDVVIPADDRDPELSDKLRACPEAVLAWLWRGWLDYQDRGGLDAPETVKAATKRYQEDSDILARFLADDSVVLVGEHVGMAPAGPLYETFVGWARAEGEPTDMSKKAFGTALEKNGFKAGRSASMRGWRGISLLSQDGRSDDA